MNGYGLLRRVYLRPPEAQSLASWEAFGWHHAPDLRSIEREHLAFRERLAEAGAEVVTGTTPVPGDPDAIYVCDPVLITDAGAIMLRPGKVKRREEPRVRLAQLLEQRGIRTVEVPDEEFPTMGPNVLALGPRIALALDGNPQTRRRLEAVGVDVRVYRGAQVSLNGDGGPTCLTRPLA